MDRSRSYSRHRPVDSNQLRSPSPVASRDSISTTSSRGRPISRPPPSHRSSYSRSMSRSSSRSQTRSPSRRQHHNHHERHQHHSHSHEGHHEHHHGLIKTSAGIIAGLGLATVLAHKVLAKDEDEYDTRSSSGSRSKHHHHHHHHHNQASERHSEHHHRRASDASSNAERIVDRARGTHGHDVVYAEETGPFRRNDARRMSLDPRAFERMERQGGGRPLKPLPYPETPYPNEKFYEPRGMRASFSEAVPVSR